MKITIIGPGAIGCLFAGILKAGGEEVCLFDRNKKRAACIQKNGLKINGLTNLKTKVEVLSDYKKTSKSDLVIFAVKSYDLKEAAEKIKKSPLGKSSFFIGLQNGLGNTEILCRVFGRQKVFSAVTSQGSTLLKEGQCRHAGKGVTYLGGGSDAQQSVLRQIEGMFNRCGIESEIKENIESLVWGKLVASVGINAITAICRIKNGEILKNKDARCLLSLLIKEAVSVAHALKIKLPYDDAVKYAETICRRTANNISSMLQDVQRGKKTEIDFINGAIIKEAKKLNLPVPCNETVTYLVKAINMVDS
ncbi:MAG: 2-dehydropantoate 2-reductase, partial [Candidatus Omnitrophota bacterium]